MYEHLLRYYLNSSTLKLLNSRKISDLEEPSKDKIFCFFIKKNNNIIAPLFNLPINFDNQEHTIFYGYIKPGKTIYADYDYSLEFNPNNFDSFIVHDKNLKCISDYCEENDVEEIEMSTISETSENILKEKKMEFECKLDQKLAKRKIKEILDEYKNLGYEIDDENEDSSQDDCSQGGESMQKLENKSINSQLKNLNVNLNKKEFNFDSNTCDHSNFENEKSRNIQKMGFNLVNEEIKKLNKKKNQNIKDSVNLHSIVDDLYDVRKFSFVIKKESRYKILQELHFKFDIKYELSKKKSNNCERCLKNDATMFCVAERASFCEKCDLEIHFDNFTKRHKRHYFKNLEIKQKFFNCNFHNEMVIDFFCNNCKIPLCLECRLNHSKDHKLITYFEASEMCDILKKNELKDKLEKNKLSFNNLDIEITKFRKNIQEVYNFLDEQYLNLKNNLNIFANKKYQIFSARYLEYQKEKIELQNIFSFIQDLDNSEIIKNYKIIDEQQNFILKDEFKGKYKQIYLNGKLTIQKADFQKNEFRMKREFCAESSDEQRI